ncbi:MAG: hypothetical protein JNK10_08740 [Cyclobacteriaceae bacterium]|nr:hypothetical protein [Cyclobacteriaceae bacterium]
MKKVMVKTMLLAGMVFLLDRCTTNEAITGDNVTLTDVAQTSGQLASGASFVLAGSSSTTSAEAGASGANVPGGGKGPKGRQGGRGFLDGTSLLAPTDELLAIVEAESAGDFRGMRMHARGGATIIHYDQDGNEVSLPAPEQRGGGPEGCSFSGKQFPGFDSLLATITRTVIDFGDGVTNTRKDASITRSGKITIARSGDASSHTEVVSFENFFVNGARIEGTKMRVSSFDESTGQGSASTTVNDGKITFTDGTVTTWNGSRKRESNITFGDNGRPVSGTIITEATTTVTTSDGTVIYSHMTSAPVVEDLSCKRRTPVSGTIDTIYRTDVLSIDFGGGSCTNQSVTITLNGVVTTKNLHD